MSNIDLGFAEECETKWLTNANFPSKIGGKPAWLHLGELPSSETLRCKKCGNLKSFLCQIYAPFDDDFNFHRTIFVFVCRTSSCYELANDNHCITVLRSQLAMRNSFYSEVPPDDEVALPAVDPPKAKLCAACGCLGPLQCGRCRKINYCGSAHQRLHWKFHKLRCSVETPSDRPMESDQYIKEVVFPEWEICMNPDDESDNEAEGNSEKADVDEQEQLQELDKLINSGKAGQFHNLPEAELEKYTGGCENIDDKYFRKFRKECAKAPKQVIRYMRDGDPIWIADAEKTIKGIAANVPSCSICSTQRKFEFQIMPQMLNYLQDSALDWGVLAIYTCPKSCPLPEGKGYTEEFVIKQDVLGDSQK
ncbi:programmed cell death protein 2 [Stomoxys calcitrans]|uniref:programmed cell death protein 2 n=1 Tax=Stomoxys calcitrans TaxID=35570 RepID=UPI0027E30441|nr:programmed cell death protein 2 [Stomoxys calcitrans]